METRGFTQEELVEINEWKYGVCRKWKKEYVTFRNMKGRCYQPRTNGYKFYGGSGIKVCRHWRTGPSKGFKHFLLSVGPKPEGSALGRIDHDKDYGPDNVKWVDNIANRTGRKNKFMLDGKSVAEISAESGLCLTLIRKRINEGIRGPELFIRKKQKDPSRFGLSPLVCNRLDSGWPLERALTQEVRKNDPTGITRDQYKRAARMKVSPSLLMYRVLRRGMPIEEAINKPVDLKYSGRPRVDDWKKTDNDIPQDSSGIPLTPPESGIYSQ